MNFKLKSFIFILILMYIILNFRERNYFGHCSRGISHPECVSPVVKQQFNKGYLNY